jgi:hypothetical protein
MPSNDIEEWRNIARANGYYEVSDLGRVRRTKPGKGTRVGRILTINLPHTRRHYPVVTLSIGTGVRTECVHVLVAEAFLESRPTPRHEVNHRDGIKTNNHVSNLEWVTRSGNQKHSNAMGLVAVVRGERKPRAILTDAIVREIRAMPLSVSTRSFARRYGLNPRTLQMARNGQTWRHVD